MNGRRRTPARRPRVPLPWVRDDRSPRVSGEVHSPTTEVMGREGLEWTGSAKSTARRKFVTVRLSSMLTVRMIR
jgi:hypothetical protein